MKALFLIVGSFLCIFPGRSEAMTGPELQNFMGDISFTEYVPPGMSIKKMITLTSDRDAEVHFLHIMQDTRSAVPTGMFVEKRKTFLFDDEIDPNAQGKAFLLDDIEKPAGVTVFEARGRKVLLLQGNLNRTNYEGRLRLKYLTNGLSMSYETCDVLLRNTKGQFWAQNAYTGEKITTVKVITHFLGVDTLEGLCPKKTPEETPPLIEQQMPPLPSEEVELEPSSSGQEHWPTSP